MVVLVNGKTYDTDRTPVMILFSKEEIKAFKSQPDHVDIHCSFPKSWGQSKGQKWMNDNKSLLIKGKGISFKVMTDSEIKKMVGQKNDGQDVDPTGLFALDDDNK